MSRVTVFFEPSQNIVHNGPLIFSLHNPVQGLPRCWINLGKRWRYPKKMAGSRERFYIANPSIGFGGCFLCFIPLGVFSTYSSYTENMSLVICADDHNDPRVTHKLPRSLKHQGGLGLHIIAIYSNYRIWLVVSNIFYFPFHIWDVNGCHPNPIDFHFFQRGRSTTNQGYDWGSEEFSRCGGWASIAANESPEWTTSS